MPNTDMPIYLIKNKPQWVAERINALEDGDALCMSFVSYAELLKGAERSTRKLEVLRRLEALTRQVPVLYGIGPALCEQYATQSTRLRTAGMPIGGNDLWIACHALAETAALVTNNLGEFSRIGGLADVNWV